MSGKLMERQQIIMNFSVPPSSEDLEVLAASIVDSLPEEILEYIDDIGLRVEELADEATEQELDLDDAFDLIVLFRSGKEISPGVERKLAAQDDELVIYRRPLLDYWCETGEDLNVMFRTLVIEELGRCFDFTDDEIEEMANRHFQGLL